MSYKKYGLHKYIMLNFKICKTFKAFFLISEIIYNLYVSKIRNSFICFCYRLPFLVMSTVDASGVRVTKLLLFILYVINITLTQNEASHSFLKNQITTYRRSAARLWPLILERGVELGRSAPPLLFDALKTSSRYLFL